MDLAVFFSFVVFAFVASITPGPNNLMVMASGAAFGWRRSLPHLAGIVLGVSTMLGAAALGLGLVFERKPILMTVLRFGGAIWLVWLAWRLAAPALKGSLSTSEGMAVGARPLRMLEAALFQWVNPKTWTIAVASAGAYSGLAEPPALRAAILIATFWVVAPICNSIWLIAGGGIGAALADPRYGRAALLTMAALVLVSAVVIAVG